MKGKLTMIPEALITDVQSIFFDLCDLQEKKNTKAIKLPQFEEFSDLDDFIEEQKQKLTNIEEYLKGLSA